MLSRALRLLALSLLLIATAIPSSAGVRFGGFSFGFGYSYVSGPYYPYYGGYYAPWGWGYPWFSPVFYLSPDASRGAVKLLHAEKTAEVYINQAFAGTAGDLKTIYLDPGAYDLEVRTAGKEPVQKRIYVLSGETLKLEF